MKIPKKRMRYCPKCKKHTEQVVSVAKKRERGTLRKGSIARRRRRGHDRGFGNQGKTSRGAISSWKMYNKKSAKKQDLRFKCGVCGKSTIPYEGLRAKKTEIV